MNTFYIVGTVSRAETLNELLKQPQTLNYCDMVELRFDETMDFDKCLQLCKELRQHSKVLLTIRTCREGGTWDISDDKRYELFSNFAPHVDYIDIELKSDIFKNKSRHNFPEALKIIGSFHNYNCTPESSEITQLIESGRQWGLDIVKLACFIKNQDEYSRLESFLGDKDLCLIGMGEHGVRSRCEFPLKGSALTYGYLDDSAAPGQLSAAELHKVLHSAE